MDRQQFIEAAGGVWTNDEDYSDWRGRDKKRHFWAFFDDDTDDYIHAIYSGLTVDELLRKRTYSIEHIIPKSFLKDYLRSKGASSETIKGARTNPLNFAASHRDINSFRRNWPFDMDEDKIIRSHTVELHGIYSDYGLDRDDQWVVPMRTQGDIARSVLYMCLLYGIDELYGEHLNVYRNWAKVDPPNIWELKYNEWVSNNHGIRNPLVADYNNPGAAFEMLNDDELMGSVLLPVR